ncbi:MAG TPA: hypothetical protein VIF12_01195 [Micavibrio sp.]
MRVMAFVKAIEESEKGFDLTSSEMRETLNATAAEQTAFDNGHEGMNQGWGGTMDQLEGFLKQ